MSNVNASGTSADSAISPNFVAYPVQTSGSVAMEPGFDNSASGFMPHGNTHLTIIHLHSSVVLLIMAALM